MTSASQVRHFVTEILPLLLKCPLVSSWLWKTLSSAAARQLPEMMSTATRTMIFFRDNIVIFILQSRTEPNNFYDTNESRSGDVATLPKSIASWKQSLFACCILKTEPRGVLHLEDRVAVEPKLHTFRETLVDFSSAWRLSHQYLMLRSWLKRSLQRILFERPTATFCRSDPKISTEVSRSQICDLAKIQTIIKTSKTSTPLSSRSRNDA